ncbi:MAG: SpoIIE family protein phosphatase [Clostridia bacterium]|nr:SpoIIE family protein phosphatase [Clostridia bacterium]
MDDRRFGGEKSRFPLYLRELTDRILAPFRERDYKKIGEAALFAVTGFLLARGPFLFGAYPFAIALLAGCDRALPALWGGCVVGALFLPAPLSVLFIALYTAMAAIRLTSRPKNGKKRSAIKKGEKIALRVSGAVIASFIPGAYGCIAERFTLHSLFALLVYLSSSGVFAFLFCGTSRGQGVRYLYKKAAFASLLFCVVYSASSLSLFGFSPDVLLATAILLILAGKVDVLSMGALGLLLGAACGRDAVIMLALVGGISALFYRYSRTLAPWLGVLCGFGWAFYDRGSSAFLYVLPDLVGGAMLSLPVARYLRAAAPRARQNKETPQEENDGIGARIQKLSKDARAFSQALARPSPDALECILDASVSDVCRDCTARCFEKEEYRLRLLEELKENGKIDAEGGVKLPFCSKRQIFCNTVNGAYAKKLRRMRESDRLPTFSDCFDGVSRLLDDRNARAREAEEDNLKECARFRSALEDLGVPYASLSVKGKRQIVCAVGGIDEAAVNGAVETLRRVFGEAGVRFGVPLLKNGAEGVTLTLRAVRALRADCAFATEKKEGEKENGDVCRSFSYDGYFYALICDGTGSGEEAHSVSNASSEFLEDLLSCGSSPEGAVCFLNAFLLSMNRECPCTVDLFRLDLFSGQASFYKCGACASLVLRGDNTFLVRRPGVPAGAVKELQVEEVAVRLKPGDRVILQSDGVSEEIESAPWLTDLLDGTLGNDPRSAANGMLARSACRQDDRTACVIDILAENE